MDDRKNWKNKDTDNLFEAILSLYSVEEAEKFFRDLMTVPEIETFAQRFKVAQLLSRGLSYRQISRETGASTATVTRINDWLERGCDGYKLAISRLNSAENNESEVTDNLHHHNPKASIAGL
jgi:TrpR-related protein YerC/YecD